VSYDPLSHSRHNVGDRSTKVGHEIMTVIFRSNLRQSASRYTQIVCKNVG